MSQPTAITIGSRVKFQPTVAKGGYHLNADILAARARQDHALLIDFYTQAADVAEDQDVECFFLTYAHIFSLELGYTHAKSPYKPVYGPTGGNKQHSTQGLNRNRRAKSPPVLSFKLSIHTTQLDACGLNVVRGKRTGPSNSY